MTASLEIFLHPTQLNDTTIAKTGSKRTDGVV